MDATQKRQLTSAGVPDAEAQHADAILAHPQAAALGLNWPKLLQLIQQFGPVVMQILMSLFGATPAGPPAPVIGKS